MTLTTLVLLAVLQTGGDPHHPGQQAQPQGDNPQRELVERIRKTLKRIDEELLDTADAEDEDVAVSLADLRDKHEQVIRDLEELIKQAKYRQSNQSSSSGSSSDHSQGSSQNQQQPKPRENDGSRAPDQGEKDAPQPEQPQGGSEEQKQREQSQADKQPQDQDAADRESGSNKDNTSIPPDPIEPVTRQDVDGRWGLLPPKLQERLTNLHVDDVPERYRTWLEAYIKALHELEQDPSAR
ncbi:MAG: hypothetical protein H6825_15980 [Planctomycetes bacterium]|nr:hypothetical protein [Planctomycetota bacterium]